MTSTWDTIERRLQCRIYLPSDHPTFHLEGWCAVLTHPHPKLGGDLNNNVVFAVSKELEQMGIATMRFNTRGVGKSLGQSTWRGIDERKDIEAAIKYSKTLPGVKKIALVAYSFGAAVGLSVSKKLVEEQFIQAVICIGYPKGFLASFLFSSHYPLCDPGPGVLKLFILGDRDDFTSVKTMTTMVNDSISEPKKLVILEDCDHFCFQREQMITQRIIQFFQNYLLNGKSSSSDSKDSNVVVATI